jgi:major membrane immunogen (membrane-anchored lipoprotein)
MSSCSKEDSISIPGSPSPGPGTEVYRLNLNADHWTAMDDGTYTCTFTNILNYADANYVKVYLNGEQTTEITNSGIQYMNGELKSLFNDRDVILSYEPGNGNSKLPFSSLDVTLVFQQ